MTSQDNLSIDRNLSTSAGKAPKGGGRCKETVKLSWILILFSVLYNGHLCILVALVLERDHVICSWLHMLSWMKDILLHACSIVLHVTQTSIRNH